MERHATEDRAHLFHHAALPMLAALVRIVARPFLVGLVALTFVLPVRTAFAQAVPSCRQPCGAQVPCNSCSGTSLGGLIGEGLQDLIDRIKEFFDTDNLIEEASDRAAERSLDELEDRLSGPDLEDFQEVKDPLEDMLSETFETLLREVFGTGTEVLLPTTLDAPLPTTTDPTSVPEPNTEEFGIDDISPRFRFNAPGLTEAEALVDMIREGDLEGVIDELGDRVEFLGLEVEGPAGGGWRWSAQGGVANPFTDNPRVTLDLGLNNGAELEFSLSGSSGAPFGADDFELNFGVSAQFSQCACCDFSPPGQDETPPLCGQIIVEEDSEGNLTAVTTTASDLESGLAIADFIRLRNLAGSINGVGPLTQGEIETFDPVQTSSVTIRGDRIDMTAGGAIAVILTNGDGLTTTCDPVVAQVGAEIPEAYSLEQNYPNPFNPTTTIRFLVPEQAQVVLEVYDVLGRRVATLVDAVLQAGTYAAEWNSMSDAGIEVAGGVYIYRITAGPFTETKSMTLVK